MLASINGFDLTPYINPKTYRMNAEDVYESWQDGNYIEHRIHTRTRIKGSFDVALYGQNGMTTTNFLNSWNEGVNNHVATMLVYVQNLGYNESIEAFFTFKGTFHRQMINNQYCDKLTIEIVER